MCKRNWKLTSAGAVIAGALSTVAWQSAWATPPKDIAFTPASGPADLVFVVVQIIPLGASRLIDEPAP